MAPGRVEVCCLIAPVRFLTTTATIVELCFDRSRFALFKEVDMRHVLLFLAFSCVPNASVIADGIEFPDNTTPSMPGGLIIVRQGNQTMWSFGGVLLPRNVKYVNQTPEG